MRFAVPQHPNIKVPCLRCGKHDGRTKCGAIHCHDCREELQSSA